MATEPKFRISLTADEISHLLQTCKSESILKKLKVFSLKAQLGIISPAFVATGRVSMEDRLGLGAGEIVSPTARRQVAYHKWTEFPSLCTTTELRDAQTYRYENNLMTPEEENEYEGNSTS